MPTTQIRLAASAFFPYISSDLPDEADVVPSETQVRSARQQMCLCQMCHCRIIGRALEGGAWYRFLMTGSYVGKGLTLHFPALQDLEFTGFD
jgi:hypothetical protein